LNEAEKSVICSVDTLEAEFFPGFVDCFIYERGRVSGISTDKIVNIFNEFLIIIYKIIEKYQPHLVLRKFTKKTLNMAIIESWNHPILE
jgi:hypothetical protein